MRVDLIQDLIFVTLLLRHVIRSIARPAIPLQLAGRQPVVYGTRVLI